MAQRTEDLMKYWPLRSIENDCIISKMGDITVCYEVTLPEIYTLSAHVTEGEFRVETGDFRELKETWGKALSVLPEHSIFHKQDFFTVDTYDPTRVNDGGFRNTFLDKASARHFHERPYLNHRCYLYLTKTSKRAVSTMQTSLVSGRFLSKEISDPIKLSEFYSALEQFVSIINSTRNVTMRRLAGEEIYQQGDKPGILERYMSLEAEADVVPLCDIRRGEDLMIGDKIVKYFSLSDIEDLPDTVYTHNEVSALSTDSSKVSVGFAAPVGLMLGVNHVYNQYIFKEDRNEIFPQLEARATQMTALASFTKANASNAAKINDYLHYAADTGYPPVRAHYNLLVWTNDKAELPQLRNKTNAAIAKMGVRPRENSTNDSLSMFWAGIPGNAADLPDEDKFWTFTPQALCLINEESVSPNSYSSVGIRVTDRLSGKPLYVDFSDAPMKRGWITNRNKFILGPSGSGKSFLTNHFLRSYFIQGAHMVIVDVGDSYEGLCSMLGGKYLTYKPEAPITFNPFYIEGRARPDIEKLESIKALLLSLWKKEEENLSRLEETALSLAVNGYFSHLGLDPEIIPSFNSFFEYLKNDFKIALDTRGITAKMFDYDAFIVVMEPFYRGGEYDYLLNSEDNLDLTSERFIVFELDNIKDNAILFPVVTIIIMDTFITKMRTLKGVRKIILIEEAWKAIMKEKMAEYIKYLYKTVRKHFGEAWIVTQEIDDILGNKIVKDSIINNADTRILMDQKKYKNRFEEVKKFLALTDQEKNLALSVNRDLDAARKYKEFFVSFAGQISLVYGLEVSVEEYLAFTTEQSEKEAVKKLVAENGGNYDLGIRSYREQHG